MDSNLLERLDDYVNELFAPEDDVLRWIQSEAEKHGLPSISIQPFEGRLLQILLRSVGARKVVEIGALAGYSGVWMARALPSGGKLITLEKSSKHAAVARASFKHAGVSDRVELREGDGMTLLGKLSAEGPFDFVFIDADKPTYPQYLAWTVDNLRAGGMVAAHNALRDGRVLAPESEDDRMMDAFNRALAADARLDSFIIGVGDGMAVGIKR